MIPSNKTIYEYLLEFAYTRSDAYLFLSEEKKYTSRKVLEYVHGIGNFFYEKGLRCGDKVALCANRSVHATILLLTLQSMGVLTYLIDPHNSVFDTKGMNGYITCEKENYSLHINNEVYQIIEKRSNKKEFEIMSDATKPTIVIFTSGSTGDSKGVLLSQYAFVNNALDTEELGDYRKDDVALCMIPIHHVFAIALIFIGITLNYCVFFPSNVEIPHLVECIDKYKITRVNGVPSLYKAFVKYKGEAKLDTLRVGFIGGAPSTKQEVFEIERSLGMKLLPVYGMSECIGISCTSISMNDDKRLSGVGRIYSMNEVILVDSNGNIVQQGNEGEILVKSPALASGYLNGPLNIENGYLKTGDVGYFDNDYILHISGRIKDIIICNGLNISSVKVEKAIEQIEGVSECAVIGIKDEDKGEIPCAFVVSSIKYTKEELIERSLNFLAKFERPREVIFVDQIVKTSTGKVDKVKLKQSLM